MFSEQPTKPLLGFSASQESIFEWLRRHKGLFPTMFTICAAAVFASPTIAGIRMAQNESVAYWVGIGGYFTVLIPVCLIVGHVWHLMYMQPKFFPLVLSTAIPSLVVMIIAYSHMVPIGGVSERLFSTDCTTFEIKHELEVAYQEGKRMLDSCVSRVATANGVSTDVAAQKVSLQDCAEYNGAEAGRYGKQFRYLRLLEEGQSCSGFCFPDKTLWSPAAERPDSCSNTAAMYVKSSIMPSAKRMMAFGAFDFAVSVLTIFFVNEALMRSGQEW